jgi:AraC-like DNA-binding protein
VRLHRLRVGAGKSGAAWAAGAASGANGRDAWRDSALALLFDEAFAQRSGREAAIDSLVEYFVVLLLRHAIDAKLIEGGVLAALADARLAKAMMAMHGRPEQAWPLAEPAQVAGMSRARFALNFRGTVGATPLDYLTDWSISSRDRAHGTDTRKSLSFRVSTEHLLCRPADVRSPDAAVRPRTARTPCRHRIP